MNMSKENSSSAVFHLFSRHDQAAAIYRQIAEDLHNKEEEEKQHPLERWFASLAEYRQQLAQELRPLLENQGRIPAKPSNEMKALLKDREAEIIRFINQDNQIGLIELSLDAEQDTSRYYREIEANKDIPQPIREQLDKQHRKILEVAKKAQRLQTVPEEKRAQVDL